MMNKKVKLEQDEANKLKDINHKLLLNILPKDVGKSYTCFLLI